jgi:hypothetical protein
MNTPTSPYPSSRFVIYVDMTALKSTAPPANTSVARLEAEAKCSRKIDPELLDVDFVIHLYMDFRSVPTSTF